MLTIKDILEDAVARGASDVHLAVGSPPAYRIDGQIVFVGDGTLKPDDTSEVIKQFMAPHQRQDFETQSEYDLAVSISGVGRFRTNVFRQRGVVGVVFRHVRGNIRNFEELNLPPVMEQIAQLRRGLVLITGTTGSGKSTTLASAVDHINRTRQCHILTLEDPIEFLHTNNKSIVTQREIAIDTQDFMGALRSALREDPDVILIGEMRDTETFQAAISAAETGHLVFSTLHTTNVMMTIDRIVDLFPSTQHDQVRAALAMQLKASVAMRLLPKKDEDGRVPAVEVMLANPAIAGLIRDNNIRRIPTAVLSGKEEGMQSFNMSLADLVKKELVDEEEAMLWSDNPEELRMNLQGIFLSQHTRGGILLK